MKRTSAREKVGWTIFGIVFVLAAVAILFPIFAKPYHPPNATVYGADGEPLVRRTFRLTFADGSPALTVRTDEKGRFRLISKQYSPGDATLQPGGLVLTEARRSTGNPSAIVFAAPVRSRFRVKDEGGKPLKLPISVAYRMYPNVPSRSVLAPDGTLLLPSRATLRFVSEDPKVRLVAAGRRFEAGVALYDFVARPDRAPPEERRDRAEVTLRAEGDGRTDLRTDLRTAQWR